MLADRFDAFLFDLDGVLYRGDDAVPGAVDALGELRGLAKGIAFVTNSSFRTPLEVVDKLAKLDISADPSEVVTSALVTAEVLAARGTRRVFAIGGKGLRSALVDEGIDVIEGDPPDADAVVIGFDPQVEYAQLRRACLLVQEGVPLVATNPDSSFPADGGEHWPGTGALVALVETTTGASAEVVGKPHPPVFEAALARAGGGRPLVVGDRLDTDIAGAVAMGWPSYLVLTGISSRADISQASFAPTYVWDDLTLLTDPQA